MGSILVNIPDISDSDLAFTEDETRQILKFFWPQKAAEIAKMAITNNVRRLAQTALIAAIEGSYAIGFIEGLVRSLVRPGSGIKGIAKRLARRYVTHWWKHTTQRDLEDIRIYEMVRVQIAGYLRPRLDSLQQGASIDRGPIHFYALTHAFDMIWG